MPPAPAFDGQKFVYLTAESLTSIMREDFLNRYPSKPFFPLLSLTLPFVCFVICFTSKISENFFHMVMSYVSGSHVYVPYGGYGSTALPHSASRILEPLTEESVFKDKFIKGVFWLVSNCRAASGRQYAAAALAA